MPEYIQTIRQQVGHQRLLVPSTACIVLNDDEEVLLELRSDNECWGLPGGIMDIGETALESARRESAAVLGFTSAIGACGGYLIPRSFGASIKATGSAETALLAFLAFYATCVTFTWWFYARRRATATGVASAGLAEAV